VLCAQADTRPPSVSEGRGRHGERYGRTREVAEGMRTNQCSTPDATSQMRIGGRIIYYLPTAIIFVAVLSGWEVAIHTLDIKQFLLPRPTAIFAALYQHAPLLAGIGQRTATEAIGGLIMGCGAGVLVALGTVRWTAAREALLPFAIAANSVPIIAFAPIINNWFGVTTQLSKMMIVAIITFFPMMINMMRGLTQVEPSALELMRSYAGSEWQAVRKVRVPKALPYMFNALKVCSTLSLIGAVVGEFFGGPRHSLGVYITQEAAFFRFENSWAAIIVAVALGIAFYLIIRLVERLAIPWHASMRGEDRAES
jgi:NitT/TauT family transport system permease protein